MANLRAAMPRTSLTTTAWNEPRARAFLDAAHAKMAAGTGMSDRTFERMAALADPAASLSRASFETALQRAGWSEGRIRRALADVRGQERRLLPRLRFDPSGRDIAFFVVGTSLCGSVAGGTAALGFALGWLLLHVLRLLP